MSQKQKETMSKYESRAEEILNVVWDAVNMPDEARRGGHAQYLQTILATLMEEKGEDAVWAYAEKREKERANRLAVATLANTLLEEASERVLGEKGRWQYSRESHHVAKLITNGGGVPLLPETEKKVHGYLGRRMNTIRDENVRSELAQKLIKECFDRWEIREEDRRGHPFWRLEKDIMEKLKSMTERDVVAVLDERVGGIKIAEDRWKMVREWVKDALDREKCSVAQSGDVHAIESSLYHLLKDGGEHPPSPATEQKVREHLDHEVWKIQSRDTLHTKAQELARAAEKRVGDSGELPYRIEEKIHELLATRGVTDKEVDAFLDKQVAEALQRRAREMRVERAMEDAKERWGICPESTRDGHGNWRDVWWKMRSELRDRWQAMEERGVPLEDIRASAREYLDAEVEPIADWAMADRLTQSALDNLDLPSDKMPGYYTIASGAREVADTLRNFFVLVPDARETYDKEAIVTAWVRGKVGVHMGIEMTGELLSRAFDDYQIPTSLRPLFSAELNKIAVNASERMEQFFELEPKARAIYDRREVVAAQLDSRVEEIAKDLRVSPSPPSRDEIRERVWEHVRFRRENYHSKEDVRKSLSEIFCSFRVPADTWGAAHPALDTRRQVFENITTAMMTAVTNIDMNLWKKEGGRFAKEEKKLTALCDHLAERIHTEVDWDVGVGKYVPADRLHVAPDGQIELQSTADPSSAWER